MSTFEMILADPVVWGALLGLSLVLGICGYYVWLFLTNIAHATPPE